MSDYPVIPELPDPPLRTDGRVDFARKGSVFLGAFPAMRTAFNDAGAWVQGATADVSTKYETLILSGMNTVATDIANVNAVAGNLAAIGDVVGNETNINIVAADIANVNTVATDIADVGVVAGGIDDVEAAASNMVAIIAAPSAAASAASSASLAASNANFVGDWASLSGSLNVPAAAFHDGKYWQLLNNLADVALSEPGVSADWARTQIATPEWVVISAGQTLVAGLNYLVNFPASPASFTLPEYPVANDTIRIARLSGSAENAVIARNGQTIMGVAEDLTINIEITGLTFVYSGTDWRIL